MKSSLNKCSLLKMKNILFDCILFLCIVNLTFQSMVTSDHWIDYTKPWEEGVCSTGNEQSPIDIVTSGSTAPDKKEMHSWIRSDHNVLQKVNWDVRNGANFFVNPTPKGTSGSIYTKLGENEYKWDLRNIHFHTSAEHTIDKHKYDMEMHFIHDLDETILKAGNPFGARKATVIGVLFEIDKSKGDEDVDKWNFKEKGEFDFDIKHLLDNKALHYLYKGGLTTPHCDEIVNWIVMAKPFKINAKKFTEIESITKKYYPSGNNRPVLPLNGRKIYKEGGQMRRKNKIFLRNNQK